MAKKVNTSKSFKEIGEAIKAAWKAGDTNKRIDRDASIQALALEETPAETGKKAVVYDVIIDQDIDDQTRMVWICIPSPDTTGSWVSYADGFNTDEELEQLGMAALFGCGR